MPAGRRCKFKNIDLLLEVTPQITPDNRISMNIFITKNDVAAIVDGVPAISTNEAETELLVNDGDTIVIGGIHEGQHDHRGQRLAGFKGHPHRQVAVSHRHVKPSRTTNC